MKRMALTLAGLFTLAVAGCSSSNNSGGTGGSGGRGGTGGGTAGTGGGTAGTGGSAGTGGRTPDAGGKMDARGPDTMRPADTGSAPDASTPDGRDSGGAAAGTMSFFVTSVPAGDGGNLGGLAGADKKCQDLAAAIGAGGKTWHAYLSAMAGPIHAKDRIGTGPWYNAKGVLVANNVAELHSGKTGDFMLFLDEKGNRVNGQWPNSPGPLQHDIITGTTAEGMLNTNMVTTCADWTSNTISPGPEVGHTDGLGPGGSMMARFRPWNASHSSASCAAGNQGVGSGGGNGRIYCFAIN